jgi:hypothetical protein
VSPALLSFLHALRDANHCLVHRNQGWSSLWRAAF